jgi:TonB-dependent receptor
MGQYFSRVDGSKNTALFGNFFTWDFKTVRDLADAAAVRDGHPGLYQASTDFTTDRRTREESKSAFIQYGTDWELGVPVGATFGLRYEKTDVTSSALVPIATGLTWVGNNEFSLAYGAPGFTKLNGSYKYFLPSLDLEADLTSELKLRASAGESIGRQSWADIQGGQTLTQLVRIDGGTGQQGNPALKPLLSKNLDLSLEYYYAKASYLAVGVFQKKINNYVSTGRVAGTPFNIHTPAGGSLFLEAISAGNCAAGDLTCIRNYIFLNHDGTQGVVRGPDDANGNQTGTIAGQPNDPLTTFLIATPSNSRADKLNGIEFNVQHTFWNTGFGVGFNYTISKSGLKYDNTKLGEQYALEGVSNSTNLVGFYEDKAASVRLAYNWRGQFLASRFDPGGNPNPIYTEAYGQWDMSLGYKLNDKLSFQAEFINLGDAIQRQHSRTKEELISVTQTGRRYMLGARYAF